MNNRRSSKHVHMRPTFEERYQALENALKQKHHTIESPRNEIMNTSHQNDLSRSSCTSSGEQSFAFNGFQRSSTSSYGNVLAKDREIAKLKALIFQKDNELIALTLAHKNALLQVEDRMERERKIFNEHKDLLLADERAKFEEEKTRLLKDLQYQLNFEQERCQHLEEKLYEAQKQSSEAKYLLKEGDRERINAVYSIKEQCRKEYQDEIARLRNQFQLEKDTEFARIQEHVRELEQTLNDLSSGNTDTTTSQHELLDNLETSEKACVRSISDLIKKLHMAMDSPSHVYPKIPNISSFSYDQASIIERLPTRNILKLLQDTADDIRNYIIEQRVQIETKTILLNNPKILIDRTTDHSNRTYNDDYPQQSLTKNSNSKQKKENKPYNPLQLSARQNHTVDNLIQKLENHIAIELDRLTKQRMTSKSLDHHGEPPNKAKFEPNPVGEVNQDTLIRHLQYRMNDLRDDNRRLRDHQRDDDNNNPNSFSSMRSRNFLTTQ